MTSHLKLQDQIALSILKFIAYLALAFYFTHALTAGHDDIIADRPQVESGPASVLAAHADDCWTGTQPDDVVAPGHVIWQHADGRTVYSARLVEPALNTLFADGNLPGQPIAFCR